MGSPDPSSNQPDHTLPGKTKPHSAMQGPTTGQDTPTPALDTKRLTLMSGSSSINRTVEPAGSEGARFRTLLADPLVSGASWQGGDGPLLELWLFCNQVRQRDKFLAVLLRPKHEQGHVGGL